MSTQPSGVFVAPRLGKSGFPWWCELVSPVVGKGRGEHSTAGSAECSDSAVTHQKPPSLPQPRDCHVLLRNTQTFPRISSCCPPRSTRAKAQHACVLSPPERGGTGCQLIRLCQAHRPPLGLQVPYALYSMTQAVKQLHLLCRNFPNYRIAGEFRWPTFSGRRLV